jgi:hypothetical protein
MIQPSLNYLMRKQLQKLPTHRLVYINQLNTPTPLHPTPPHPLAARGCTCEWQNLRGEGCTALPLPPVYHLWLVSSKVPHTIPPSTPIPRIISIYGGQLTAPLQFSSNTHWKGHWKYLHTAQDCILYAFSMICPLYSQELSSLQPAARIRHWTWKMTTMAESPSQPVEEDFSRR